ncbi:MAG: SDR family NAD(P)-dependent oxidoreductase [Acidimicrobiia bacterium]
MGELDGKVAIVTGAAQGLGAAVCDVFVREGATVVVTDVQAEEGRATAGRLGDRASFLDLDVTDEASWQQAVDEVQARHGRVDVLVNNAGMVGGRPLGDTTPEVWARTVAVNQTGPFLGCRAVVPGMVAAGGGAIVNVGSTMSVRGRSDNTGYTATKHGVLGLTRALALEVAPFGIRVNAVVPGAMRTPMFDSRVGDAADEFAAQLPIRRLSDPHEVAEVVSFVASSRASFCVGATFVADGGMTVNH